MQVPSRPRDREREIKKETVTDRRANREIHQTAINASTFVITSSAPPLSCCLAAARPQSSDPRAPQRSAACARVPHQARAHTHHSAQYFTYSNGSPDRLSARHSSNGCQRHVNVSPSRPTTPRCRHLAHKTHAHTHHTHHTHTHIHTPHAHVEHTGGDRARTIISQSPHRAVHGATLPTTSRANPRPNLDRIIPRGASTFYQRP